MVNVNGQFPGCTKNKSCTKHYEKDRADTILSLCQREREKRVRERERGERERAQRRPTPAASAVGLSIFVVVVESLQHLDPLVSAPTTHLRLRTALIGESGGAERRHWEGP